MQFLSQINIMRTKPTRFSDLELQYDRQLCAGFIDALQISEYSFLSKKISALMTSKHCICNSRPIKDIESDKMQKRVSNREADTRQYLHCQYAIWLYGIHNTISLPQIYELLCPSISEMYSLIRNLHCLAKICQHFTINVLPRQNNI